MNAILKICCRAIGLTNGSRTTTGAPALLSGILIGLAIAMSARAGAQAQVAVATPNSAIPLSASGRWSAGIGDVEPGSSWNVAAVRLDNNELRGRVTVLGSPVVRDANLEGRISGRGVVGVLLDDEGRVLVEFDGTMTPGAASGTYRDRSGGSGRWQAEQPLP